jgi:hypothetical protein
MREPAFNTIALMLAVYVAALVWGFQHVSDRYSPNLLMTFSAASLCGLLMHWCSFFALRVSFCYSPFHLPLRLYSQLRGQVMCFHLFSW